MRPSSLRRTLTVESRFFSGQVQFWSVVVGLIYSGRGRRRSCLIADRCLFASSRRSLDARVGFVGRRGVTGASASRKIEASRVRASALLRSCDRCSDAVTVRTPSDSWEASRLRALVRCVSLSAVVVEISMLSWTRESEVLTPWPPGPEACENRSLSSTPGIVTPLGIPGPGGTHRSSTSPVSQRRQHTDTRRVYW